MNEYRWADISLGLKHGFDAVFTPEMAEEFASISGDFNPLHIDGEYAKGAGYSSPVLFGMLTSSLYSALVGMYLPGKYALLQGIDLDFKSPCHSGERLRCEVVFLSEAFHRFEVKATIRKEDRKLVSKALIRVGFHGE
jgi:3-hydroxybutyryl-CoA dehydratase